MASNISNVFNNRLRLTGMSSGLDTEAMIKKLMTFERAKVDKVKQSKTLLEWKKDDYRSIINSLRSFRDEYFDSVKPASNFRSPSAFASYDTKSDNELIATIKAGAGAISGTHTLVVKSLATAASITSTSTITSAVEGRALTNTSDLNLQGKQIDITLDGVRKTISLTDCADIDALQASLQAAVNTAFGKIDATNPKLKVLISDDGNNIKFEAGLAGSTFSVAETSNNFISALGFSSEQKNYIVGKDISTAKVSTLNGIFKIKLGAVEKEIELTGLTDDNTLEDVRALIQDKLNDSLGADKAIVSLNNGKLDFITKSGEKLTLTSALTNSNLSKLGFTSGASVTGTGSIDFNLSGNEKGKTFVVNIDGVDQTVKIGDNYSDINDLRNNIQSQLSGVTVEVSGNKLVFKSDSNEKIVFKKGPEDSLASLGFTSFDNRSNKISFTSSLESIKEHFETAGTFVSTDPVQFTINGTAINLGKNYTQASLNDVMAAINTSSAGVELKFDSLNDKFTLTSKVTGSTENIVIDGASGLFTALGIDQTKLQLGNDAIFDLDGIQDMQRSKNEFTINDVTYTLKSTSPPDTVVNITVNANPDGLVSKIQGFVSKYNELIDKINGELSETKSRGYQPLTDEQKEAMKDSDIINWETKAKTGILGNDSLLNNIVNSMRRALTDKITDGNLTLSQIGITTGDPATKGKLFINETKLRAAIKDNVNGVAELFSKESQYSYSDGLADSAKRKTRYEETGLAQRLNDIIQDNIRTTRHPKNDLKGALLEKAGISGDGSDYKNTLNTMINEKDTIIDKLLSKLYDKEDSLYKKFAAMEKAMSQMNSQSSWLTQQFGGGQ